ncbi:hypothetical protein [Streptomyces gobitricini]|uniref:Integral membrane protein n=1 Tax=Streptomyces gobitricini TaxID=68211 RepID=A0ABP5YX82_9ACTN
MADPYPHAHPPAQERRHRPGTVFAVVNAAAFTVHLVLACAAPGVLATRVSGETPAGVPVLFLQVLLLVWTAVRYDR